MGITEIEHTSAQNCEHVALKLVPGFIFLLCLLTFLASIYLAKFQNKFAPDNISLSFLSWSYAMIHNILSARCGIPSSYYGVPLQTKLVWIFWKCDIESWVCRKCYITFELMYLNVLTNKIAQPPLRLGILNKPSSDSLRPPYQLMESEHEGPFDGSGEEEEERWCRIKNDRYLRWCHRGLYWNLS